jgi:hypothetical protein
LYYVSECSDDMIATKIESIIFSSKIIQFRRVLSTIWSRIELLCGISEVVQPF